LANLRNALGMAITRGLPGERREKKPKQQEQQRHWTATPTINTAMRDQLVKVGLVEESLRQEIKQLQRQLTTTHNVNKGQREQIVDLKIFHDECWCRHLRRFKQRACEVFWTIFSWNCW
jgi:hypothetical protein